MGLIQGCSIYIHLPQLCGAYFAAYKLNSLAVFYPHAVAGAIVAAAAIPTQHRTPE